MGEGAFEVNALSNCLARKKNLQKIQLANYDWQMFTLKQSLTNSLSFIHKEIDSSSENKKFEGAIMVQKKEKQSRTLN